MPPRPSPLCVCWSSSGMPSVSSYEAVHRWAVSACPPAGLDSAATVWLLFTLPWCLPEGQPSSPLPEWNLTLQGRPSLPSLKASPEQGRETEETVS